MRAGWRKDINGDKDNKQVRCESILMLPRRYVRVNAT